MSEETAAKAFFASPDHDAARREEERILKAMERKTSVKLYAPTTTTTTTTVVSKPAAAASRPAAPAPQPAHTPAPAPAPASAPAPRAAEPGPGVATFTLSKQEQEDEIARREAARLAREISHTPVSVQSAQPAQPSSTLLQRAAANAAGGTRYTPHAEKTKVDVPQECESSWGAETEEQVRREEQRLKGLFGAAGIAPSGSQQKSSSAAAQPAKLQSTPLGSGPSHAPTLVNVPIDSNAPASIGGAYEREIWSELNKARSNPKAFANYLRSLEACYSGNVFTFQGTNMKLETQEGVAALREAVAELERTEPILGVLKLNEVFSRSALDLVNEHGPSGKIAAKTEEESRRAAERLVRYGTWKRKVIETIAYGPVSAKDVVAFWLIDDGTPDRGNRRSVLDRTFQVVGIASGPHAQLGRMVVVDWTEDFIEGATASKAVKTSGFIEHSVSEHAEAADHKTGVLQELPDGSGFVIDVGILGVPKAALGVKLRNGIELQVSKSSDGKVFYYKYELPFAFRPDQLSAEYTADQRLLVKLKKPASSGSSSETTISQFALSPASDRERVEIDIKETKDQLLLKSLPSRFNEEVTVKLRDSKIIVWESKHVVDDAEGRKIITSTQTLKLPFEVSSGSCQIILHGSNHGATLQITKPTGGVGEVEIPIFG